MVRVLCAACRTHIYNYTGKFSGKVRWQLFVPVEGSAPPSRGERMECRSCKKAWYLRRLDNPNALVILTDQGFRPQDPMGQRRGGKAGVSLVVPHWPTDVK